MALAIALVFISFGLAAADVAHLARSYLPPARLMASLPLTQRDFSGSRTSSFTASGGYSNRLTAAAPTANYIAPAANYVAPAANYIAPAANYIAPATASYQSTNLISAPARLTASAPQSFVAAEQQRLVALPTQSFVESAPQKFYAPAAQNLIAPASQSFIASAPAAPVSAAFTARQFNSNVQLAQPSREYLSPEVETFEPLVVKQSYTAPAITYSAPAGSSSAFTAGSANIETQYSADGGYVY